METAVDLGRLAVWLDGEHIGTGPIDNAQRLAGGTQNVLLRFERAGRRYVLRRPALNPRPEANKLILREARVLSALARTNVPHPALIATCASEDVIGTSFYVMQDVAGFSVLQMPARYQSEPVQRHKLGLALLQGLVALADVNPVHVGLGDFGKLDDFLERQVTRWASQLESYRQYRDWPGPAGLGSIVEVGTWLEAHRPGEFVPALMHGDYHIGNVLFRHEDGTLAAILDWELSTLGDALLDLGRLLCSWPDREGQTPLSLKIDSWEGFPDRDELIEHYSQRSPRSIESLPWFEVLAAYKLAIILEGTHARASAGQADADTGKRLHESAKALVRRATTRILEDA